MSDQPRTERPPTFTDDDVAARPRASRTRMVVLLVVCGVILLFAAFAAFVLAMRR